MTFYEKVAEPKELEITEGGDHFWFGREDGIVGHVAEWVDSLVSKHTEDGSKVESG